MHQHRQKSSKGRRLAVAVLAVAGLATAGLATASSSDAAGLGLLPTTTTVTATPSTAGLHRSVHITATVSILGLPGLGITPTGNVTFSSNNTDSGPASGVLGTVKLGFCLLTACTASIDAANLGQGDNLITATYAGDLLAKGSTGTTHVTVNLTSYTNSVSSVCLQGTNHCNGGLITDGNGTWGEIFTDDPTAATGNSTYTASIGGPILQGCAGHNAGATASFVATPDLVSYKTFDYTVIGTSAPNLLAEWNANQNALGCFQSTSEFNTFDGSFLTPAPADPVDGGFEAPLPSCDVTGGETPCFVFDQDTDQYGNEQSGAETVEIRWENGTHIDPKYTG